MTGESPSSPLRRVGVIGQTRYGELGEIIERLYAFASKHGYELHLEEALLPLGPGDATRLDLDRQAVDLLLTLGGDGTLLRGGRMVSGRDTPVLGINLGYLGFLTAAGEDEIDAALEHLRAGSFFLDRRFTLEAQVVHSDGSEGDCFVALNDVVLHKAGVARVVRLSIWVGDDARRDEVGSFSGDGVIVATPTGSTAYSLSAGGPIIDPALDCLVVTPICPHTLAVRPLVLPADEPIRIQAHDRKEELVLTVDGQAGMSLSSGDTVVVRQSRVRIPLVRFPGQTFFSTLRRKLSWAL